jgi:transcriptional regulator with XRE-family HTH domain
MELTDRIRVIMKTNNMNAATFADKIGVQRANMSHVLTGRNKPSLDFIERILISFPKVNALWLITGKVGQEEVYKAQGDFLDEGIEMTSTLKVESNHDKKNDLNPKANAQAAKIVKIITFYDDSTFDEYHPTSK